MIRPVSVLWITLRESEFSSSLRSIRATSGDEHLLPGQLNPSLQTKARHDRIHLVTEVLKVFAGNRKVEHIEGTFIHLKIVDAAFHTFTFVYVLVRKRRRV